MFKKVLLLLGLLLLSGAGAAASAQPKTTMKPSDQGSGEMRVYASKYYVIHSDLPADDVKEAIIRMNKMAEEYHARTAGFSGDIRERLPFFLFKSADEYYTAGGMPGSAGVFIQNAPSKLMAIAGEDAHGETWHIVQHEGFHQFAAAVIRGELPAWVNEGIAEYFGESLFTGDGFVVGVIPPDRLQRLQSEIKSGQLKSIQGMMMLSYEQWNSGLAIENYDQGWSMVHFLAQADDGKYQQPFVAFMQAIGRGTPWTNAWAQTFGKAVGFEERWKEYWLNMPPNPTASLYAQATAATLTSYLGRATAHKQRFTSFDEFIAAAKKGEIQTGQTPEDWLPSALLEHAVASAQKPGVQWSLEPGPDKNPQVIGVLPNGDRLIGSYLVRSGHVARVGVEVDDTAGIVKQADELIEQGKKDRAKAMLQRALRAHPKSTAADDARKALLKTK